MLIVILISLPRFGSDRQSECFGTSANGRLEYGVKLPASGKNFTGYRLFAMAAGRTYVHLIVRDIIVTAYKTLETQQPDKGFKYAETGFRKGGPFKPHKTHRNGLSMDFMVPVIDRKQRSVHLPTNPLNKFG